MAIDGKGYTMLQQLWQQVLGVDKAPGSADDFYLRGGSSLSAAVLGRLIYDEFGVEVTVAEVLSGGTFGAVAALVSERMSTAPTTPKST